MVIENQKFEIRLRYSKVYLNDFQAKIAAILRILKSQRYTLNTLIYTGNLEESILIKDNIIKHNINSNVLIFDQYNLNYNIQSYSNYKIIIIPGLINFSFSNIGLVINTMTVSYTHLTLPTTPYV